ncbi:hemerythrin-like metal-binding domain-containing protein [Beggiatoa alba B18LD]|uniref:Hemerythrin-like metal-binding domain-containing protein n=1 Tax=Beggiatoa alba B18LD TaxID=395493 RepID=I3CJS1_9GAMM|nr:hemerythrin domain-containing protein [Beggiatoa alba]EIJ43864.1 hemerythrin-like metal-binding domain-containing protein [Beggiatoa alba B18LD]
MPLMDWSDAYQLGLPLMDDTHQEFVALVNKTHDANNADFKVLFTELLTHTQAHFDKENQLMVATKFPALGEHQAEHQRVINELKQFKQRVDKGMISFGRAYIKDRLPEWFALHTKTMDSALAVHLQRVNYSA